MANILSWQELIHKFNLKTYNGSAKPHHTQFKERDLLSKLELSLAPDDKRVRVWCWYEHIVLF